MALYDGVNGVARKVTKLYDGVDGVARKVTKAYDGVDGVARLYFSGETPIGELPICSIVYLNVDGTPTEFIVIQHGNPDSSVYGNNCDGTWLLMKDIFTNMAWGSNVSTKLYTESGAKSYLTGTFMYKLDQNIQNILKRPYLPYTSNTTSKTVSKGLIGPIFLLSMAEHGLSRGTSYHLVEGVTLAGFLSENRTKYNDILYPGGEEGEKEWTRTPSVFKSYNTYVVSKYYTSRSISEISCMSSSGIRPALILPSDTLVDSNFNVIA